MAPDTAWEAHLRWGTRRLTAEVLDGRGRTTLLLGDSPEDDIAIGNAARIALVWRPNGLEVRFSAGVVGELSSRGVGRSFSQLVVDGRVAETPDGFALTLTGDDVLTLRVGTLIAEVRRVRTRFPRLPIDAQALLFIALALLGVGIVLASVMAPPELPRLHWLKRSR